jgi:hypothetical protein
MNVLLVKLNFFLHILKIGSIPLQLALATALLVRCLRALLLNLCVHFLDLTLMRLCYFPVLVFNSNDRLLLVAVLLQEMLLEVNCIADVLVFRLSFRTAFFALALADLEPHCQVSGA